eukprot:m.33475 g.33475  ORF g.33475 m.33475 type:complete len:121 (+) comp14238_c0_seq2:340-702(+)
MSTMWFSGCLSLLRWSGTPVRFHAKAVYRDNPAFHHNMTTYVNQYVLLTALAVHQSASPSYQTHLLHNEVVEFQNVRQHVQLTFIVTIHQSVCKGLQEYSRIFKTKVSNASVCKFNKISL